MSTPIESRLRTYTLETVQDLENAMKEISQSIALQALFRAGFFKSAAFHGGTCLRICHGLQRFSEDLDFCAIEPGAHFAWNAHEAALRGEFAAFGFELEVRDRSELPGNVKKAFIKSDAMGKLLQVRLPRAMGRPKQVRIKLELDTNPPRGAVLESRFVDFPGAFPIVCHDLPTGFAGKVHALLCREYAKGRDWYDFVWYTSRDTSLNPTFLADALDQAGPWRGRGLAVDGAWVAEQLEARIAGLDWDAARRELSRFVNPRELPIVESWTKEMLVERARRCRAQSRG